MTPADFLAHANRHNLRHPDDSLLTADDFPAFEICLDFLSRVAPTLTTTAIRNIVAHSSARAISIARNAVVISSPSFQIAGQFHKTMTLMTGLNSDQLATRAERFARMTGRHINISYGVMAAAILHLKLPGSDFGAGRVGTFISGEDVKDALDDLKWCAGVMRDHPEPIVDEAVILAKLSLHGIDAPIHIVRLALAPRPDRIVAIVREPGSAWLTSGPLITRPWADKMGLEHLLDSFQ